LHENEDYQGLYMVIYPTDKKVLIDFSLIFYCKPNQALVIKSLKNKDYKAK
jgi:hypothetical protein